MGNNIDLVYKIEYEESIPLSHLAKSLNSIDAQFVRHLKRNRFDLPDSNVKFHVKEIRKGSIEAVIIPVFLNAIQYTEDVKNVISFAQTLGGFMQFLRGKESKPPFPYEKADLTYAKDLAKPVASGNAVQLNVVANDNAKPVFNINMNQSEAREVLTGANEKLRLIQLPETTHREQQLLYFRVTEDTTSESKYHKGVIETISDNLVTVYSPDEKIMAKILEKPYGRSYLIDVDVRNIEGEPSLYIITKLHEIFER